MASQEQMQKYKELFLGKVHQIFLVGMGLFLLLRLLMAWQESSTGELVRAVPESIQLKHAVTDEKFKSISPLFERRKEFKDSDYRLLANFNMFDAKTVLNAPEIARQADQKYREAAAAAAKKNYNQALQLVEQALALQPSHMRAKQLQEQISKNMGVPKTGDKVTTQSPAGEAKPKPAS